VQLKNFLGKKQSGLDPQIAIKDKACGPASAAYTGYVSPPEADKHFEEA
jgi:hypothetical protein